MAEPLDELYITDGPDAAAPAPSSCSLSASFQFPDSAEGGFLAWGWSKRVSAMTTEVILDFVVTMLIAIALGIVLSIGGICLIDSYLGPIDKVETHYPSAGRN